MTDLASGMVARAEGPTLYLSQNDDGDALLSASPFALVIGMLLDQQIPMEKAFLGPYVIQSRLADQGRGPLEPSVVAGVDADEFVAIVKGPPAVHRFPAAMAKQIQRLAAQILDQYGGDTEALWRTGDAYDVRSRLEGLPHFGPQKARIFLALLGKQYGVQPDGWSEASAPFGEQGSRISVADVTDAETLAAVRESKKAAKAAKAAKNATAPTTAAAAKPRRRTTPKGADSP